MIMKIYVIMQKATEYNDEYDAVQEEGAKIYKAYRNKPTEVQVSAAKWDAIRGKTPSYDDNWPDDIAYIEEIEVDESQIENNEVTIDSKPKNKGVDATYAEAQLVAQEARAEASRLAKDAVNISVKALFGKYPDLISFSWTQYTPYFNDGDECVFSVYADYPEMELEGIDQDEGNPKVMYFRSASSDKVYVIGKDYRNGQYVINFSYGRRGGSLLSGTKTDRPVDYKEASAIYDKIVAEKKAEGYGSPYDDIKELLSGFDEDDLKQVFGDHVKVIANRQGVETEEYSHD